MRKMLQPNSGFKTNFQSKSKSVELEHLYQLPIEMHYLFNKLVIEDFLSQTRAFPPTSVRNYNSQTQINWKLHQSNKNAKPNQKCRLSKSSFSTNFESKTLSYELELFEHLQIKNFISHSQTFLQIKKKNSVKLELFDYLPVKNSSVELKLFD